MPPYKQRSIVSQHLHSTYRPEEHDQPFHRAGFNTNDLTSMLRTPSSEPAFKQEHAMDDLGHEDSEEAKYSTQPSSQKPLHPYQVHGSFEHTAMTERRTLNVYLKKFVKESTKANDITADQRFPMLWELRERKLKELEDMGKLTMRTHPDRVAKGWTSLDDDLWVRKHFSGYLSGRASGTSFFAPTATASRSERIVQRRDYNESSDEEEDDDDQDDEELDAPGIKREYLNDDEIAVPRASSAAVQPGTGTPRHLKAIEGKAVTRSFCCRSMLNEVNGVEVAEGMQNVQRTWKWIDGRMVVWPAFETVQQTLGTEICVKRADSVVGAEIKVAKQQPDGRFEAVPGPDGIEEAQGVKRPAENDTDGEGQAVKKVKIEP